MTPTASRVLLIGLDGAAFPILEPLMSQGLMPRLSELIERGSAGVLRSTAHPLSPPAWASIMTGRQPGSHGIFDFVRVDHGSGHPAYSLVSSADLRGNTVFDLVSGAGRSITALNFPCMFPPPNVHGSVVPGYVPWSYLGRACQPRGLFQRLRRDAGIDPRRLAVDWEMERTAVQGLQSNELARWVDLHIERERQWATILTHLMKNEPSDLTAVVFDGVDRIQHLCLHLLLAEADGLSPESVAAREECLRYFALLDQVIGDAVDIAGPEASVLIVSDHGARMAGDRIFYANTWLAEHGYLHWRDDVSVDGAARLAMNGNAESTMLFDWDHTLVAALTSSSNALVVHRAVQPGDAGVAPHHYRQFCRRLASELLEATDPATGERIVEQVLLRDETFPGPLSDNAPDLTLVLNSPGFLSVLRGPTATTQRTTPYGTHHPDGIFVAAGASAIRGQRLDPLTVVDVAPTILQLLGLPIPDDLDGAVAAQALTADALSRQAVPQRELVLAAQGAPVPGFDAEGEAEVMARLRLLGYVE